MLRNVNSKQCNQICKYNTVEKYKVLSCSHLYISDMLTNWLHYALISYGEAHRFIFNLRTIQ